MSGSEFSLIGYFHSNDNEMGGAKSENIHDCVSLVSTVLPNFTGRIYTFNSLAQGIILWLPRTSIPGFGEKSDRLSPSFQTIGLFGVAQKPGATYLSCSHAIGC
jgi:hypothetical protein